MRRDSENLANAGLKKCPVGGEKKHQSGVCTTENWRNTAALIMICVHRQPNSVNKIPFRFL